MPRYLAIDYGRKRIGLAVGDSESRIASPASAVAATGSATTDISAILQAGGQYEIDSFVLGLPLNMNGTEGAPARHARALGLQLAKASGKPVHFWDERLSSVTAEEKLTALGLTRKKKKARTDCVAAQTILQEFLDALAD